MAPLAAVVLQSTDGAVLAINTTIVVHDAVSTNQAHRGRRLSGGFTSGLRHVVR